MNPGTAKLAPKDGPQPHHVQRRERGRAPQRRHDRARRLHRRAPPPGAQAGAADLLRPGHRRRGRSTRRQPDLAAALDRLESGEGRLDLLQVAEQVHLRAMLFQHRDHFQRADQVEPRRRPPPQGLEGLVAQRALPGSRGPARPAHQAHRGQGTHRARHAPRPGAQRPGVVPAPATAALGPRRSRRRRRAVLPAVHSHGEAQLDHLERASTRCAPRHLPATWSSAARGGAAVPSSCAPTSTPTRSPIAMFGSPIASAPPSLRHGAGSPGRAWPASRPTSTSCATASPASTCSTTGCASFRGRLPSTLPAADPTDRSAPDRTARRRRGGDDLDALYDRLCPAVRSSSTCGADAGSQVEQFRADRGITPPLQPRRRVRHRLAQGARRAGGPQVATIAETDGAPAPRLPTPADPSTFRSWSSSTTCAARPPGPSTR